MRRPCTQSASKIAPHQKYVPLFSIQLATWGVNFDARYIKYLCRHLYWIHTEVRQTSCVLRHHWFLCPLISCINNRFPAIVCGKLPVCIAHWASCWTSMLPNKTQYAMIPPQLCKKPPLEFHTGRAASGTLTLASKFWRRVTYVKTPIFDARQNSRASNE